MVNQLRESWKTILDFLGLSILSYEKEYIWQSLTLRMMNVRQRQALLVCRHKFHTGKSVYCVQQLKDWIDEEYLKRNIQQKYCLTFKPLSEIAMFVVSPTRYPQGNSSGMSTPAMQQSTAATQCSVKCGHSEFTAQDDRQTTLVVTWIRARPACAVAFFEHTETYTQRHGTAVKPTSHTATKLAPVKTYKSQQWKSINTYGDCRRRCQCASRGCCRHPDPSSYLNPAEPDNPKITAKK